jgi:hypothetical protein
MPVNLRFDQRCFYERSLRPPKYDSLISPRPGRVKQKSFIISRVEACRHERYELQLEQGWDRTNPDVAFNYQRTGRETDGHGGVRAEAVHFARIVKFLIRDNGAQHPKSVCRLGIREGCCGVAYNVTEWLLRL